MRALPCVGFLAVLIACASPAANPAAPASTRPPATAPATGSALAPSVAPTAAVGAVPAPLAPAVAVRAGVLAALSDAGVYIAVRDFNAAFDQGIERAAIVRILTEHTTVKDVALYDQMVIPGLDADGYLCAHRA